MTFISIDKTVLENDLKNTVAEIIYQKRDGQYRTFKCSLKPEYIKIQLSEEEKLKREASLVGNKQNVIHVWDVDNNYWWAFRTDKVLSCQMLTG